MTAALLIIGIIVCIALSAFFSASEMAFSSANEIRLENSAEEGSRKAGRASYILKHFEDALSSILIGNNLVNIASSSMGSVLAIILAGSDKYAWISGVVITVLVIIFGETIPKIAAKQNATALAEKNALAIRALMTLFTPIVLPVVWITDRLIPEPEEKENDEEESEEAVQELQSIIEIAEDKDVIDEDQSELAQAAIDFSDTAAFEVMTARVDMECIDIDDDWDEILELCMNTTHSRIPVYEDSVDNIIGILTLNHFFKALAGAGGGRIDIRELLMPPLFVYKTMKMPTVLDRLRDARQHLAVVADEYGGTLGIVSMEDVLEEIVGDIWDENDVVEKEVVEKRDGSFELDGDMVISDFTELMELDEDEFETDSDTVGGWTIEMLEEYPKPGDSFEYGDLKVTVLGIDDLRVTRVKVERLGEKTE